MESDYFGLEFQSMQMNWVRILPVGKALKKTGRHYSEANRGQRSATWKSHGIK